MTVPSPRLPALLGVDAFAAPIASDACTGMRLIAKDGSVVYGRRMKWRAFDLNLRVTVVPRGYGFPGTIPDGETGKTWTRTWGGSGNAFLTTRR